MSNTPKKRPRRIGFRSDPDDDEPQQKTTRHQPPRNAENPDVGKLVKHTWSQVQRMMKSTKLTDVGQIKAIEFLSNSFVRDIFFMDAGGDPKLLEIQARIARLVLKNSHESKQQIKRLRQSGELGRELLKLRRQIINPGELNRDFADWEMVEPPPEAKKILDGLKKLDAESPKPLDVKPEKRKRSGR